MVLGSGGGVELNTRCNGFKHLRCAHFGMRGSPRLLYSINCNNSRVFRVRPLILVNSGFSIPPQTTGLNRRRVKQSPTNNARLKTVFQVRPETITGSHVPFHNQRARRVAGEILAGIRAQGSARSECYPNYRSEGLIP